MPKKYDEETKARAVRLVVEHRADYRSEWEAMRTVAGRLGMHPETLRLWMRQAQVDAGEVEGVTTSAAEQVRRLERKNAELEETIEILKAATSFFVRESDPLRR